MASALGVSRPLPASSRLMTPARKPLRDAVVRLHPMPSCSARSRRSSRICRPTAIAASTDGRHHGLGHPRRDGGGGRASLRVDQPATKPDRVADRPGSCYLARGTRRFARDLGSVPRTTPLESPQSKGTAEAFVRTSKRDYVYVTLLPDAESMLRQLPVWLAHSNDLHPHRAQGCHSPRQFIARSIWETLSGL